MISKWSRRVALGAAVIAGAALVGIAAPAASAATPITAVSVEANRLHPDRRIPTYTVDFHQHHRCAADRAPSPSPFGGNALTTRATYTVEAGATTPPPRLRFHWQT